MLKEVEEVLKELKRKTEKFLRFLDMIHDKLWKLDDDPDKEAYEHIRTSIIIVQTELEQDLLDWVDKWMENLKREI